MHYGCKIDVETRKPEMIMDYIILPKGGVDAAIKCVPRTRSPESQKGGHSLFIKVCS